MSKHYIDNDEMLSDYMEYYNAYKSDNKTPVPDALGTKIYTIAKHISFSRQFVNYTYRDDMVSHATLTCILYIHNFNPEKSSNIFGYTSRMIHNAMVQYIKREHRYCEVKDDIINQAAMRGV